MPMGTRWNLRRLFDAEPLKHVSVGLINACSLPLAPVIIDHSTSRRLQLSLH